MSKMNKEIKRAAEEAARLARVAVDATKNEEMRGLALAVFSLAKSVERLADSAPEGPPTTEGKRFPPESTHGQKPPLPLLE